MITHHDPYAPVPPKPNTWMRTHVPLVSVKATATKDAPGSGKRLVVTGFTVTIGGGATAPAATMSTASLTSGGDTLWGAKLGAQATAAAVSGVARAGYWPCPVNQSVTLAFSGTATNVEESVSMEGYEEDVAP
jgi:hypothetical protein